MAKPAPEMPFKPAEVTKVTGAKIQSQQYGISDLLSEGWNVSRSHFKDILIVVVCIYIPINLMIALSPSILSCKIWNRWPATL